MGWACSPGRFASFAFPPTGALPAGIAFFRFGFTGASYPRNNPWNPAWSLNQSRTNGAFLSGTWGNPKVDIH